MKTVTLNLNIDFLRPIELHFEQDENDPHYFKARERIAIGDCDLHAELIEIRWEDDEYPQAMNQAWQAQVEAVCDLLDDGPPATVVIDKAEYVLLVTPFAL